MSDVRVTEVEPNVMVLLDMSGSMEGERWGHVRQAFDAGSLDASPRVGLSLFPTDGFCGVGEPVVEVAAEDAATAIEDALWFSEPTGATPMGAALNQLVGRPELQDSTRDNIVVLLTDGTESCDGHVDEAIRALVGQQVPVQLRIVGVGTFEHVDAHLQSLVELTRITTPNARLMKADEPGDLIEAFGAAQRTCRLTVNEPFDGVRVGAVDAQVCRSEHCDSGYDYDEGTGELRLIGETCAAYLDDPCGTVQLGR
ncbi:MAG: VWA domain-containing protein [Proteobacteria bacterium]|nr:VWA domain-containing protein [Pseudomonadota bacterium]